MSDVIRKAVELADGWENNGDWLYTPISRDCGPDRFGLDQFELDALAAQLVRQVDALVLYRVRIEPTGTFINHEATEDRIADCCLAGDRTMNTIKAIVDSGVLAGHSNEN